MVKLHRSNRDTSADQAVRESDRDIAKTWRELAETGRTARLVSRSRYRLEWAAIERLLAFRDSQ